MPDPAFLLVYLALAVAVLALVLAIWGRAAERRRPVPPVDDAAAVAKDIAMLLGEVRTLVAMARVGLLGSMGQPQAPAPAAAPEDAVAGQLHDLSVQLRSLRLQMERQQARPREDEPRSVAASPPVLAPQPAAAQLASPVAVAPQAAAVTAPAPEPAPAHTAAAPPAAARQVEVQPVPARLLDAVLTDNLTPALLFLQDRGGSSESEQAIPGGGQTVAKLLSLRLARADERGVYLTDAGRDIARLLDSVGR